MKLQNYLIFLLPIMIELKNFLVLEDFQKIIFEGEKLNLSEDLKKRVSESHQFLMNFSKEKVIYGVNTGFGPMAQFQIPEKDRQQLQYNLIRSHSCGMGTPMEKNDVLALMLCRLNTLSLGFSGVDLSLIELLKELINKQIIPVIPQHGGVGASGDLVQLAHLALVLIGEGEVFYQNEKLPTQKIFEQEKLSPIKVKIREGLSIMNGTSAMTGIGINNFFLAQKIIHWTIKIACLMNEITQSYDDHFSTPLNESKLHLGQRKIAQEMQKILAQSPLIKKREEHLYKNFNPNQKIFKEKVQEYYSLRCVPQILGPVWDTLNYTKEILTNELNSANDNPIVSLEEKQVFHGGNFHGDYISLEMDKLKIAITKVSMLIERQLNYLLNPKINEILPPFVNLSTLGLNFGLQALQFTATSTTAENQTLSNPMYIHSIPNNNDNQDIVSMGTNSALLCRKVIDNTFEVISIQLIALAQAVDYLKIKDKLCSSSKELYQFVREEIPAIVEDKALNINLLNIKNKLLKSSI